MSAEENLKELGKALGDLRGLASQDPKVVIAKTDEVSAKVQPIIDRALAQAEATYGEEDK